MIQCASAHRTYVAAQHVSARPCVSTPHARLHRRRLTVQASQEGSTSSSTTTGSTPAPEPVVQRKFKSLGSEVIEQNTAFEEPPAKDMWEGEQFEAVGQFMERWFLPALVVLGLVCGGIAANSYNEDADVYITPASGPDELPKAVPASLVQQQQQLEAPSLTQ